MTNLGKIDNLIIIRADGGDTIDSLCERASCLAFEEQSPIVFIFNMKALMSLAWREEDGWTQEKEKKYLLSLFNSFPKI
jgi:hypothetical protein